MINNLAYHLQHLNCVYTKYNIVWHPLSISNASKVQQHLQHELLLAGLEDVTEVHMKAVPHGSPTRATGSTRPTRSTSVTLSHHCSKLTVVNLSILQNKLYISTKSTQVSM